MTTTVKNTSFVLDPKLREFIREQVDRGGYRSASEVMHEALERFADEKRKEEALLAALDDGVASGRAAPGGASACALEPRVPARRSRARADELRVEGGLEIVRILNERMLASRHL